MGVLGVVLGDLVDVAAWGIFPCVSWIRIQDRSREKRAENGWDAGRPGHRGPEWVRLSPRFTKKGAESEVINLSDTTQAAVYLRKLANELVAFVS